MRLAELIAGRTSQPIECILAMLMRDPSLPDALLVETSDSRVATRRVAVKIVRIEDGADIDIADLLPA